MLKMQTTITHIELIKELITSYEVKKLSNWTNIDVYLHQKNVKLQP